MISISWGVDGEPARRLFGRFLGRVRDPRPVLMGPILRRLRNTVRSNFLSQGALATPGWAKLSRRAAMVKPRKGILRVTDRLFESLTTANSDAIAEIGPDGRTLLYGTRVSYFRTHQDGIDIPKRQPVPDPLPETLERQIRQDMRLWVLRGELSGGGAG